MDLPLALSNHRLLARKALRRYGVLPYLPESSRNHRALPRRFLFLQDSLLNLACRLRMSATRSPSYRAARTHAQYRLPSPVPARLLPQPPELAHKTLRSCSAPPEFSRVGCLVQPFLFLVHSQRPPPHLFKIFCKFFPHRCQPCS